MTLATFRHFCTTARVLDVYTAPGSSVAEQKTLCDALLQAVRLGLRTENVRLPDHQHANRTQCGFNGHSTVAHMLLAALYLHPTSSSLGHVRGPAPSPYGLEVRHGAVYVKATHLEDWQREVVAYQNPLPLLAATWLGHCLVARLPLEQGVQGLCATLCCSTLPGVHDARLQGLIQNDAGTAGNLCDLHMHINGATEFSHVWLHSLENLRETFAALKSAEKSQAQKMGYFYKQLRTSVKDVFLRLEKAAELRQLICRCVAMLEAGGSAALCGSSLLETEPSWEGLEALLHRTRPLLLVGQRHPFFHPSLPLQSTLLQKEGAMWFHALHLLQRTHNPFLATLLHVYMLFMNQHLRLLVQQQDQYGFDQFQYITLAGAREAAEAPGKPGFSQRFRQFHGMYGPDLAHVEARFAPKKTVAENLYFLKRIWQGHVKAAGLEKGKGPVPCVGCPKIAAQSHVRNGIVYSAPQLSEKIPPTLGLVVHFIKSKDDLKEPCRHAKLRDKSFEQARCLVATKHRLAYSYPELAAAIVGKDAASNELEAPPEVFARTFRYLNSNGITCTTYHAGEDFEHILGGMRAVHEAMLFLDMGSGDRIGHATALGLEPDAFPQEPMHCAQGKWLDDLIWLTWFIETTPTLAAVHGAEVARWRPAITRLYRTIYKKRCPSMPVLWKAWQLRAFDVRLLREHPMMLSLDTRREYEAFARVVLGRQHVTEQDIADMVACAQAGNARVYPHHTSGQGNGRVAILEGIPADAIKELVLYHTDKCREHWKENITLGPEELPQAHVVRAVQDALIQEMRRKSILVEVLPTSNVRISHYARSEDHHVMRWLNPEDPRPAPQVVVGTDNPGIFSTTLRNEYTFILHQLQAMHPEWSDKPYEVVRHLIENGKSFRFRLAK